MRWPRTISWYILREILQYTILGFLFFSIIIVAGTLGKKLGPVIALGISLREGLTILTLSMAMIAPYTIPIAFLFGILSTYARLSSDSEIIAMRTCGLGLRSLFFPALMLATLLSLGMYVLMIEAEPSARWTIRKEVRNMAVRHIRIEPGKFTTIRDRVIFVKVVDEDETLHNLYISDRKSPERPLEIFASQGFIRINEERQTFEFSLEDGEIHLPPQPATEPTYRRISFEEMSYSFDISELFASKIINRPRDLSTEHLREFVELTHAEAELPAHLVHLKVKDPWKYEMELQRRFAMPLLPLLFTAIGLPLGLRKHRSARSWGAFACVGIVFGYYAVLSFGEFLGTEGMIHPLLASWAPNAIFVLVSIPLIRKANRGEA